MATTTTEYAIEVFRTPGDSDNPTLGRRWLYASRLPREETSPLPRDPVATVQAYVATFDASGSLMVTLDLIDVPEDRDDEQPSLEAALHEVVVQLIRARWDEAGLP